MNNIKQENAKDIIINVKNLYKKYFLQKKYAVEDASFKVFKGSFHGFIGQNGAGKTTTIKAIIGAYANFKGQINIMGVSNKKEEATKKIGYVPEKVIFPSGFSVFSYVKSIASLSDIKRKDLNDITYSKLKEFQIIELAQKDPNKISSGQKKKVLLIQALIHNPKIIIMDEPAANLDPTARKELFSKLQELTAKGITVFISSHVLDEIEKYIDSFTLIHEGKIVYSGSMENIQAQLDDKWVIKVDDVIKATKILEKENAKFEIKDNSIILNINLAEVKKLSKKLSQKVFVENVSKQSNQLNDIFADLISKNN